MLFILRIFKDFLLNHLYFLFVLQDVVFHPDPLFVVTNQGFLEKLLLVGFVELPVTYLLLVQSALPAQNLFHFSQYSFQLLELFKHMIGYT